MASNTTGCAGPGVTVDAVTRCVLDASRVYRISATPRYGLARRGASLFRPVTSQGGQGARAQLTSAQACQSDSDSLAHAGTTHIQWVHAPHRSLLTIWKRTRQVGNRRHVPVA